MTAVWSFVPQEQFTESLLSDVTQVQVSPLKDWVGTITDGSLRSFELRYTVVTSAIVKNMAQFFTDRRGAYDPFQFRNPNDDQDYIVRFDTDLRPEHFAPGFFRTNPLTFTLVSTIPRIIPASLYIIDTQVRSTLATFATSLAGGSTLVVNFSSPLGDGGWLRLLAASSGTATAPYSFTVMYQDATSFNSWLSRRETVVSTNAMLEYELLGTYGRFTFTAAASGGWIEGGITLVPLR